MSPVKFSEDEVTRMHDDSKKYLVQRWEPRPGYKPLILTHGDGVYFWDAKGKKY
jgi:4-aminobutyrate aminotransferase-like enzyme